MSESIPNESGEVVKDRDSLRARVRELRMSEADPLDLWEACMDLYYFLNAGAKITYNLDDHYEHLIDVVLGDMLGLVLYAVSDTGNMITMLTPRGRFNATLVDTIDGGHLCFVLYEYFHEPVWGGFFVGPESFRSIMDVLNKSEHLQYNFFDLVARPTPPKPMITEEVYSNDDN